MPATKIQKGAVALRARADGNLSDVASAAVQAAVATGGQSLKTVGGVSIVGTGDIPLAAGSGPVSSDSITDAGATGKTLLKAGTPAAAKVALSLGTAADRATGDFATAAQGAKADAAVKTVNNTAPDAAGNVTIAVSAGAVASTGITDSTAAGRALITAADVAAQRTALGLGTAATLGAGAFATSTQGGKADSALQQAAADARYVRTVNNSVPDVNGNVTVAGGPGGATTVANNLTTNDPTQALSAAQGVVLSAKEDGLVVGTAITFSRTLTPADFGKFILVDTSTAAVVLTFDAGSAPAGVKRALFRRSGANALTIVQGSGTLSNPNAIAPANGDAVGILSSDANTAVVFGTSAGAAKTNATQHWTAPQVQDTAALAIVTGAVAVNLAARSDFTLAVTGACTISNPTGLMANQRVAIWFTNAGANAVAFGANWHPALNQTLTVQSGADKKTLLTGVVDPTGTYVLAQTVQEA